MIIDIGQEHRLNVCREGPLAAASPAIVLLHGLGTDASLWEPQRQALSQSRCVVSIEFPGHGLSPDWPDVTLQALFEAVWHVADQLGLADVVLAGSSMGAVVALGAAAMRPQRVKRLLLCGALLASSSGLSKDLQARARDVAREGFSEVADAMVARWFPPGCSVSEETRQRFRSIFLRTSPQGYRACASACAGYDLVPALAALQDRTWLVTGDLDGPVPMHFRQLSQSYPLAQLLLMEGVGHYPSVEKPSDVNRLIAAPS